ncbi:MAG: PTS sugar transporter subunit IIA [Burkholderiales bacterium]|nr:PTS sugar transporter subunit IIA [Burkholderiales bacterium]
MHKGILIVAHKPIASAFYEVVTQIYGQLQDFEAVDIISDEPKEAQLEQLKQALAKLHTEETVILTDLCGATPSNVSHQFSQEKPVLILDPLSIPLLMKVICYRGQPLSIIAQKAEEIKPNICTNEDNHCNCNEQAWTTCPTSCEVNSKSE